MNIELLLNSASDDDDDETLSISLSIEKEANNNNHNHHCAVSVLSSSCASSLTMPSPNRPLTPMTQGLIIPPPPSSDGIVIKTQRPSTPSNTLDDKDGNDSEGKHRHRPLRSFFFLSFSSLSFLSWFFVGFLFSASFHSFIELRWRPTTVDYAKTKKGKKE